MPRISHSRETLEYLQSIGVDASDVSTATRHVTGPPAEEGGRRIGFLVVVAMILMALLACAVAAADEEAVVEPMVCVSEAEREDRSESFPEDYFVWEAFFLNDAPAVETLSIPRSEEDTQAPLQAAHNHRELKGRICRLERVNRFSVPVLAGVALYVLVSITPRLRGPFKRTFNGLALVSQVLKRHRPFTAAPGEPQKSTLPSDCRPRSLLGAERSAITPVSYPSSKLEGVGFQSVTGPVRPENQDACLAWCQGHYQIVIVADGLGGLPEGGTAARLATVEAARSLSTAVGVGYFEVDPQACLAAAFRYASNVLFERVGIPSVPGKDGLRTTLIVTVCEPTCYRWGYIGDGGLWIRRQNGDLEKLMTPQKADALHPNILAASLGPATQGTPEFGQVKRKKGDLLFAGTDGVFDRVDDSFAENVAALAIQEYGGDLQHTVEETLRQLSAAEDDSGYLCDDNMTLALVGNDLDDTCARQHAAMPQDTAIPVVSLQEDEKDASENVQSE